MTTTLNKTLLDQAKLSTAHEAVMLADLTDIAQMDRKRVDQVLAKQLGVNPLDSNDMANIHLGDVNQTTSKFPWKTLVAVGGLAAAATGIGAPIGIGMVASALPGIIEAFKPPAQTSQPATPVTVPGVGYDSSVEMSVEPPK